MSYYCACIYCLKNHDDYCIETGEKIRYDYDSSNCPYFVFSKLKYENIKYNSNSTE